MKKHEKSKDKNAGKGIIKSIRKCIKDTTRSMEKHTRP